MHEKMVDKAKEKIAKFFVALAIFLISFQSTLLFI